MRTLLVTGGSGYLGSEVVREATSAGWTVIAPPRSVMDVRDADAVASFVKGADADAIVHAAYRAGEDGTAQVARAAAESGARLVHVSTDLVFDGTTSRPYREEDEPRPIIRYGEEKLAAERAARAVANAVVVRTSVLYGKDGGVQERLVLAALEGSADVAFFADEIRCPTQLEDLAAALVELAESSFCGVLHVAGPDAVSRYDLACAIARARGCDPSTLRSATSEGLGRPKDCSLDCSRARSVLRAHMRGIYK